MMDYSDFDVWEFKRDDANRWVWRRLTADGEVRLTSRDALSDLEDCISDARRCGYLGSSMAFENAAT
jgi:hypothetical protein